MSIYTGRDLLTTQKMLYSRGSQFNGFEDITDEDKKRIIELVNNLKKAVEVKYNNNANSTYYRVALDYLTHTSVNRSLKSFDERIFYLINAVDPHLQAYYLYIQREITAKKAIKEATDPKDVKRLQEIRAQQLAQLEDRIREELGFYDATLIKYEEKYRQKFVKEDYFVENVKVDFITSLLDLLRFIKGFKATSDDRYQALVQKAQMWLSKVSNPTDANSLAYNIFKQNHLLNLRNVEESLIFFILTIDPELKALRIYEEESTLEKMQERTLAELGFYNMNMVKAERMYHARFTPDMKISEWTI